MSAAEILRKAVEYDTGGRRLEALKLYEDGIRELLQMCKNEPDAQKKSHIQKRIEEFLDRAEEIKKTIEKCSTLGEVIDRIHIMELSTGYSYMRIFGKYLTVEVREVIIEEPYLKEMYQLSNLVMFFELVVKRCSNLKFVKILTLKDERQQQDQSRAFRELAKDMEKKNIQLDIEYREHMHDRQIILSSGYIIKIGRGLHFYKPPHGRFNLGYYDFDLRECRETNVDIFKCKQ